MQSVQNLGHQQRSHDAHQDNRHRMRDSASIESKDREKIFTCHGKDRMEHIDWQGVSPNIQNHLKRFAMTKSFERREKESIKEVQRTDMRENFCTMAVEMHLVLEQFWV